MGAGSDVPLCAVDYSSLLFEIAQAEPGKLRRLLKVPNRSAGLKPGQIYHQTQRGQFATEVVSAAGSDRNISQIESLTKVCGAKEFEGQNRGPRETQTFLLVVSDMPQVKNN